MVSACLVDVYDTIITVDFRPRLRALAALAGVDPELWAQEWLKTGTERGLGKLSMAGSFAQTLRACGVDPEPGLVEEIVRTEGRLLREGSRMYDDVGTFFGKLRSLGIATALVSNCSPSTRPMLEDLGAFELADAVTLSCEVGSLKPSPEIYLGALADLGVAPADAAMIDDQARFCVGAEALGVRGIQIVRDEVDGQPSQAGFPVVRSLLDALPLL